MQEYMTPRRRFMAALYGGRADRPPLGTVTSLASLEAMDLCGACFPAAHRDPRTMSTLAECASLEAGFDMIFPLFSVVHEAAALGAPVDWGRKDCMPSIIAPLWQEPEEIAIPTDFEKRPAMAVALESLQTLKRRHGDRYAIIGKTFGPWSLGFHLFGVENILMLTIDDPEKLARIFRGLLAVTIRSATAQAQAGADALCLGDHCSRDMCSPETYRRFLLPLHRELARAVILRELGKIIIGQRQVLDQVLVTLFARGHCLIVGVPGLAKTLIVRALAGTLDLECKRVQFTPDLMPPDITGTNILEEDPVTRARRFRFNKGPVFTNLLLADEINRTPPKTQAALLEAMQERRVSAGGATYDLPQPFMVLATQNPIEQEGTYPLPEAQLDRFMLCIHIGYPGKQDEKQIILETTRDCAWEVERVLNAAAILEFQRLVRQVPVSDHVALYATNLIRATRPGADNAPDYIGRWVRWGAGPRAGQYLLLAAKTRVLLEGRFNVSCADVREYALPVLRHRIFCNFTAASEGVGPDEIVARLLETVKEPDYG